MANPKPAPADWHIWAPLESDRALRVRFKLAKCTITRLRRETGIYYAPNVADRRKPVPVDFAEKAKRLHRNALARHYNVGHSTMTRWFEESGVKPALSPYSSLTPTMATPISIYRDTSFAGRCADFLRKKDPIFRCDEGGRQNVRGKFFFWLQRPRTEQFIIDTAMRKGFDPHAWERLAA